MKSKKSNEIEENENLNEIEENENLNEIEENEPESEEDKKLTHRILSERAESHETNRDLESLYNQHKEMKLILQPDFQRNYIWDDKKASNFIESLIKNIKTGTIFLWKEKKYLEETIDGQQRLFTIIRYFNDEFVLVNMVYYKELEGKKFSELPRKIQNILKNVTLHIESYLPNEDEPKLKTEIFTRLNKDATPLNPQEIRNATYMGKYNSFINETTKSKKFKRFMVGLKNDRMQHSELILRVFAFNSGSSSFKSFRSFLDDEMENKMNITDKEIEELKKKFLGALDVCYSIFGDKAFRRYYFRKDKDTGLIKSNDGYWGRKATYPLFELLVVSIMQYDKKQYRKPFVLDAIKEAWFAIFHDEMFYKTMEARPNCREHLQIRHDKWKSVFQKIIYTHYDEHPRCFSLALKEELYNANSTCAICKSRIINIDDAAIDHTDQYWLGGETIPENGRLTHRRCNNMRPRKEK